jgi:hypothetical protein
VAALPRPFGVALAAAFGEEGSLRTGALTELDEGS